MKLHCVRFHDAHEGTMLHWFVSPVEARAKLAALEAENEPQGVHEVECVDVPTTRDALVIWLNANLNRDNG